MPQQIAAPRGVTPASRPCTTGAMAEEKENSKGAKSKWRHFWAALGIAALGAIILIARTLHFHKEVADDLLRDFGIALLLSGAIAMLIEFRRASLDEKEAGLVLLSQVLGSQMGAEAWTELQRIIAEKRQVRRDVLLSFEEWVPLEPNLVKAKIHYKYDAYSTTGRDEQSKVRHELDYQVRRSDAPSWVSVKIDGVDRTPGDATYPRFEEHVTLTDKKTTVEVTRWELIHVPGSWNLYLTQWTRGLTMKFVPQQPSGLEIVPVLHPRDENKIAFDDKSRSWTYPDLLVPGQGLEFKFIEKRAD
jgi:hypothetical protein